MTYTLRLNGEEREIDAPGDMPVLWAIRDEVGLTGTKFGCGVAACGACTVHVNGEPTGSCQLTLEDAAGAEITTIEGLSGKVAQAVQAAWVAHEVAQCGYCQSGQVMAATALLSANPRPTDAEINDAMDGNACRCATYVRIREAVHAAAKTLEG